MFIAFYVPMGLRDESDPRIEVAMGVTPDVFETLEQAQSHAKTCYAEDMELRVKEVQEDIDHLLATEGPESATVRDRQAEQAVYIKAQATGLSWESHGGRWIAEAEFTYGDMHDDGLWVVLEN